MGQDFDDSHENEAEGTPQGMSELKKNTRKVAEEETRFELQETARVENLDAAGDSANVTDVMGLD
jgi:hypothetical protein